jgi:hypothetical protein
MDKTGTKKRNTTRNRVDERVKEEEDTQGTVERKKTEGVGTSQGIQGHGRSQEKDDGDGLPDESPVKRKVRLKKKKVTSEGKKLFMVKFNLSPSDTSSGEVPNVTSTTVLGSAAVSEEVPVPAEITS